MTMANDSKLSLASHCQGNFDENNEMGKESWRASECVHPMQGLNKEHLFLVSSCFTLLGKTISLECVEHDGGKSGARFPLLWDGLEGGKGEGEAIGESRKVQVEGGEETCHGPGKAGLEENERVLGKVAGYERLGYTGKV